MRKAFRIKSGDVSAVVTHRGRVIVATSEEEIALGPPGEVFDLDADQVTVSRWLAEQGHPIEPQRTPPLGGTPRRIRREHLEQLIEYGRAAYPRESCGMIIGRDVPGEPLVTRPCHIYNTSPTPRRAYRFAEEVQLDLYRQMDEQGWDPLVIWHTHTFGDEHPSDTDLEMATEPDAVYLIASYPHPGLPPTVGYWHIRDGVARPVAVELVD